LNNRNIENFMKLVTCRTGPEDKESCEDQYYRRTYEKLSAGKTITWNWNAFLFSILWLFYRKMYLAAVLVPVLTIAYYATLLLLSSMFPTEHADGLFVTSVFIFYIFPWLLLGMLANWMYVRHVHKKIDKGYHLCELKNTDGLSAFISAFIPFLGLISGLIITISDKRKVKKAKRLANFKSA